MRAPPGTTPPPDLRTSVYIDGFNFYYGAVKGTPYKWLDFKRLLGFVLHPRNRITTIKYFTALVSGRGDPDQPIRQQTYLNALQAHIPELSIHYGLFKTTRVMAYLATPIQGQQFAEIVKTEEKGSDVNIAVHMLNDAWLDRYDCAVLVSNDSDLAETLSLIRQQHPAKKIGLIFPRPSGYPVRDLMTKVHFMQRIRRGVLANSQLPNPIPGTTIHRPASW